MWPPAAARQRQRVHAGTRRSHAGPKTDRQAHTDIQRHTQTDIQVLSIVTLDPRQTDRHIGTQIHTDIYRQTATNTDRQTSTQRSHAGPETDRQAHRHTDTGKQISTVLSVNTLSCGPDDIHTCNIHTEQDIHVTDKNKNTYNTIIIISIIIIRTTS